MIVCVSGGWYLSVPELKAGQTSIRGARLAIQVVPSWSHGDLCLSFSHWLTGHHVGVLQLFVRKKGRDQRYSSQSATTVNSCWSRLCNTFCCCRYGPALWSRTGGHGWRHTHVTLTTHSLDRVRETYMTQICCWAEFVKLMMTDVCACRCCSRPSGGLDEVDRLLLTMSLWDGGRVDDTKYRPSGHMI